MAQVIWFLHARHNPVQAGMSTFWNLWAQSRRKPEALRQMGYGGMPERSKVPALGITTESRLVPAGRRLELEKAIRKRAP